MKTEFQKISTSIADELEKNDEVKFVIYPFGDIGILTKTILEEQYNIYNYIIIDNEIGKYNSKINRASFLPKLSTQKYKDYKVLLTTTNIKLCDELIQNLKNYISQKRIIKIFSNDESNTIKGRYSYGPLCNHWLVAQVGNFSSFAVGTDVVENHPVHYISTHPFLYYGNNDVHKNININIIVQPWHFPNSNPICGKADKLNRIIIGNDVWLGKNVIITNSSNIGNGVIAAAGAVITKDIPDYAVVAGVPAKIIRYRYNQTQIKELNKIKWWDWPDDKIEKYYMDFFIDINKFIEKHRVRIS